MPYPQRRIWLPFLGFLSLAFIFLGLNLKFLSWCYAISYHREVQEATEVYKRTWWKHSWKEKWSWEEETQWKMKVCRMTQLMWEKFYILSFLVPESTQTTTRMEEKSKLLGVGGLGGLYPAVRKYAQCHYNGSNYEHGDKVKETKWFDDGSDGSLGQSQQDWVSNFLWKSPQITKQLLLLFQVNIGHPCDQCTCRSGKLSCFWKVCDGSPDFNCVPLFVPGNCCPIYTCNKNSDIVAADASV